MTTTPNNDIPRVGDLVELRKGDTIHQGRVLRIDHYGSPLLGVSSTYGSFNVNTLRAEGYTLTIKERAPEPLPTVLGLYVARDDWAYAASFVPPPKVYSRDPYGWKQEDAEAAHAERGGLVRLVPVSETEKPALNPDPANMGVFWDAYNNAITSGAGSGRSARARAEAGLRAVFDALKS